MVNIMSILSDYNKDNSTSPQSLEETLEIAANPFKALFIGLICLAAILSIFALLPLFFTYLSEGDIRAPSELHPTDSAIKLSLKNSGYSDHAPIVFEKQTVPPRKHYNNVPME